MGCCEALPEKKQTLLITNNYTFTFTNSYNAIGYTNNHLQNSNIKEDRFKKISNSLNKNEKFKNIINNNNNKLNDNTFSATEIIDSYVIYNNNHNNENNTNKEKSILNTNSVILSNTENTRVKSFDLRNEKYTNKFNSKQNSKRNTHHKSVSLKSTDIPKMKQIILPNNEVPKFIIENRKKLILTVIESKHLEYGTKLTINPGGLETSERMCLDGVVLFGNKVKSNKNSSLRKEKSSCNIIFLRRKKLEKKYLK